MSDLENLRLPNTRAIVLEGIRQALQARVAQIFSTVTLASEPKNAVEERFRTGVLPAIEYYEHAWDAVDRYFRERVALGGENKSRSD